MVTPTLLQLADGRFPSGGHAHSLGVEPAAAILGVGDAGTLESFVAGQLTTTGLVDAAFAAAVAGGAGPSEADDERDARFVVANLAAASRSLGRQLVRVASGTWPEPWSAILADTGAPPPGGWHQCVAFGVVARALDVAPDDIARVVLHQSAATMLGAYVRLRGLDPTVAQAALARSAPLIEATVADATAVGRGQLAALPVWTAPAADVASEDHTRWEVRLFGT